MKTRNQQKQNIVWQQIKEQQHIIHMEKGNQEAKDEQKWNTDCYRENSLRKICLQEWEMEGLVTPVSTTETSQKTLEAKGERTDEEKSCVLEVKKSGKIESNQN